VEGRDENPPDEHPSDEHHPDEQPSDETPWARPAEGEDPEPDWAEQIRSGRKARGSRLREVYSKFADEPTPLDDEADPE
jgi:hypothetical protein